MNRKNFDFDLITLVLYLTLTILGWMTIYAVTSTGGHTDIFDLAVPHGRQLIWIGVSLVIAVIILSLDYRFIEGVSYLAYGGAMLLLVLVLFVGKEVNGAKSWLIIAGQPFQPSEFAKLATAMALAKYMSGLNFSMNRGKDLAIAAAIVLFPAIIVIFQNDTGSALVFGSFMIVFFREGLNPLVPIFVIITGALALFTIWLGEPMIVLGTITGLIVLSYVLTFNQRHWGKMLLLHLLPLMFFAGLIFSTDIILEKLPHHQRTRIMVLFDPSIDPQGAGYNVIQSKIAIGSGGIAGKGFLQGNYTKYKFVPKQETDFIYCTIGEEYGWIGTSMILLLMFTLIWRLKFLSENSKTRFARIYGYSVIAILFFHVLVNVGMTIGLIPVIGIPLPFFSYGGSSLLAFTILIFLMINLYSYRISVLGSKF